MTSDLREVFFELSDRVLARRTAGEEMRLSLKAESSDFVRFNKGLIRQPGSVEQRYLTMELIRGRRHSTASLSLLGDMALDEARALAVLEELRPEVDALPEDPHLVLPEEPRSMEQIGENRLPSPQDVAQEVVRHAEGTDFVGILGAGGIYSGFASSLGQRSWFASYSFNLDFSLYAVEDKAIKDSYAGFEWDVHVLAAKIERARERLEVLKRPAKELKPGEYRVYLAPAALDEILGLLGWWGFGLRAHRRKFTPLLGLLEGEADLSPLVSITENSAEGVCPSFDDEGFVRPPKVPLIREGKLVGALVSPRSAKEYGVETNAAAANESPMAVDMAGGGLPMEAVEQTLGEGIYVGNLWYLNYSDRKSCRITGMTRFGTYWVKDGQVVAPMPAMRFDESLYRMLGKNLEDLTRERQLLLDPSSYCARSTRSSLLPGALVRDFRLTL